MNHEESPEGRIAGAVMAILRHLKHNCNIPDHADFRDGLRESVQRELILAQQDLLKKGPYTFRQQEQLRQDLTIALLELRQWNSPT